jgi:hypothetical protein
MQRLMSDRGREEGNQVKTIELIKKVFLLVYLK